MNGHITRYAMSCIMYHGPDAERTALNDAPDLGFPHTRTYGEGGLKTDDAREVSELLQAPPFVGDQRLIVLVGPVDQANQKAADALLKAIEEFDPQRVLPLLWAEDVGSVSRTILTRCRLKWCPGEDPFTDAPDEALQRARGILTSILAEDIAGLCTTLRKEKDVEGLYRALVHVLAWERPDPVLWMRLRPLASLDHMHYSEILAVLLEAVG